MIISLCDNQATDRYSKPVKSMDKYAQWELSQILTLLSLLHKKRILILTLWRIKNEQGTVQLIQGSPWKPCGKEALVPWSLIRSLTPLHGSIGNKLARTTSHLENYLFFPSAQTSSLTFPTNKGVLPLAAAAPYLHLR